MRKVAVPLLMSALLACGGEPPTADEQAQVQRGGHSSAALGQVSGLADSLFNFDPTLDASKAAIENAAAIKANTEAGLAGCGTVAILNATVTVEFGAAGCKLPNGMTVKGTVEAAVARVGVTTTVSLKLTQVDIDGLVYDGTAGFATTNGNAFTVALQLTTPEGELSGDVTVVGSTNAFTLGGTATTTKDQVGTTATFDKVLWQKGYCYPEGGTVEVKRGVLPTVTIAFDTKTATTGQVTVTQGRKTFTAALPSYGRCHASGG